MIKENLKLMTSILSEIYRGYYRKTVSNWISSMKLLLVAFVENPLIVNLINAF